MNYGMKNHVGKMESIRKNYPISDDRKLRQHLKNKMIQIPYNQNFKVKL